MDDDLFETLNHLSNNVRNTTIDTCIAAITLECRDRHMKDYPMTIATLICNRLRALKSAEVEQ